MLMSYAKLMYIAVDTTIVNMDKVKSLQTTGKRVAGKDAKNRTVVNILVINDIDSELCDKFITTAAQTVVESSGFSLDFDCVSQRNVSVDITGHDCIVDDYAWLPPMDMTMNNRPRLLVMDDHALGDACENLIALKDFHESNPDVVLGYRGTGEPLFWNIPWIDRGMTEASATKVVKISMDLINNCNLSGIQVVRAIEYDLMKKTGRSICPGSLVLPVTFSKQELEDDSIFKANNIPENYWIINAGGKDDFPTKHYPHSYFQRIVDITSPYVNWVQIGANLHEHRPLTGVINMIGKTANLRDLCKLVYQSSGVLTTISAALHLSAMPWKGHSNPRPAVIIGGGREPSSFTQYPNHHWFSTVGCLECSESPCWRGGLEGASGVCSHPVRIAGQIVPKCQTMIPPDIVAEKILQLSRHNILS